MTFDTVTRGDVQLATRIDGEADHAAPTLVFANSLGSTMAIWEDVLSHLPVGLRIVRYDMRGHGQSSVPPPPYTMGALVADAEAVCDAYAVKDALFVGLSVGGMVAQGLAVKRPDLIRALVLSDTAARIGNKSFWDDRIALVEKSGMALAADHIIDRWFGKDFRHSPAVARWRDMLSGIDPQGYAGVCAAIAGTDFYTPTSGLRIPTLGIAGSEDKSTPPDLVRETLDVIPGSQFQLMRRAGHLPCIEQPEAFAKHLSDFIAATGHMAV